MENKNYLKKNVDLFVVVVTVNKRLCYGQSLMFMYVGNRGNRNRLGSCPTERLEAPRRRQ